MNKMVSSSLVLVTKALAKSLEVLTSLKLTFLNVYWPQTVKNNGGAGE